MKYSFLFALGAAALAVAPLAQAARFDVDLGDGGVRIHQRDHWDYGRYHNEFDRAALVRTDREVIHEHGRDIVVTRRTYESPDGSRFVRESRERVFH